MKKLIGLICCAALLLMCGAALAEVRINDANFPDKNFQKYVEEELDTDQNGVLSEEEIQAVTGLGITERHLKNMKGLEFFTALEGLNLNGNDLTELDLSSFPNLKWVSCSGNQLTALDVSANPLLDIVDCSENQITGLDLSQNEMLRELICRHNQLTELDVSHNSVYLRFLDCGDNRLTELDVSSNPQLEVLVCDQNELTHLELGRNDVLSVLECMDNHLGDLDVRNCNNLNLLGQLVQPHNYTYEYGWVYQDAIDDPRFDTNAGRDVWINSDRDMHLTVGRPDKAHQIISADAVILDDVTFEEVTSSLSKKTLRLYLKPDAVPDEGKYFTGDFILLPDGEKVEGESYIWKFEMPDHGVTVNGIQADLQDAAVDLTGSQPVKADIWLLSLLSMQGKENLSGTEAGYDFYLDLNGDGKADVACGYSSDEEEMGAMKRLPGADELTESCTLSFADAGDNMAPYRSATLKFVP